MDSVGHNSVTLQEQDPTLSHYVAEALARFGIAPTQDELEEISARWLSIQGYVDVLWKPEYAAIEQNMAIDFDAEASE